MTSFLQLHFLTVYPPANLNRDDTGRPKTAQFGGTTRLRISSQSLKRAWRVAWKEGAQFQASLKGHLGERTQRFGQKIEEHLLQKGKPADRSRAIAREVGDLFGKIKGEKDANPTHLEQLAFIGPEEWKMALGLADRLADGEKFDLAGAGVLRSTDSAIDIAMFGRMLADDPDFNREAAAQVAHAITTHRVTVEDDYYTAVDDLKTSAEDAGAVFIGEAGFGSGVFYLYCCIDRDLLVRNLAGDVALAAAGIGALIEAAATVAPRGKQASFASRARTSFILAEMGDMAPRTLASAFIGRLEEKNLLESSISSLLKTRSAFAKAYGDNSEHKVMNVPAGEGTLADVIAFAKG